jgi:hypothetical protein
MFSVLSEYIPSVERIISLVLFLAAVEHADKVRELYMESALHSCRKKMVCCLHLFLWRTFIMVACSCSGKNEVAILAPDIEYVQKHI